jgi:heme/copper-type cytochrome/quinol oxidase subunit 3
MNRSLKMSGPACLTFIIIFSTVTSIFADAAQDQESETYVSGMTSGRAKSLIGVALGVSSLIIGWRTKARSKNKVNVSKSWPIAGVILGSAGVGLSILHLTASTGGFGTGGGKAGAIVGLLVGVCGGVFSVLALRIKKVSSDG